MRVPKIVQDALSHRCDIQEESLGLPDGAMWFYLKDECAEDVFAWLLLFGMDKHEEEMYHADISYHIYVSKDLKKPNPNDLSIEDGTRNQINIYNLCKYLKATEQN